MKDQVEERWSLPFSLEEYWEWKEKLEAGYGQPRAGVSAEEVEREIASIPGWVRHTYLGKKYLPHLGF